MLLAKIKDIRNREIFLKKELLKKKIKFLFINLLNKNNKTRQNSKNIYFFLKLKNRKSSKTKLLRRCIFNNRSRGSIRSFGVSRILLREMFQFGIVPGVKKAVW
jgi:small subunit ribosomal protein S14